jgi:KDO2-lipid IV(A) lauroyltransferase
MAYFFVKTLKYLFSLMPFPLLYRLSDLVAWFLRVVVRYRLNVSKSNLERAFPEASHQEIQRYLVGSYRNLADITLETIKGYTISEEEVRKRYVIKNPDVLTDYLKAGKSVILAMGHISNWEWAGLALGLLAPKQVLCIYHRIKNQDIDNFVCRERSRFGMIMFPSSNIRAIIKEAKAKPSAIVLVADQSPTKAASALWVDFFGIDTGFVPGPEIVSKRNRFPYINMLIKRVKRGFYEVEFVTISDIPETTAKKELTQIYARQLEEQILNDPPAWLWSHKRWKKVKPEGLKDWN